MYLLTEMILFSPLIVYACIRVRKLIARPASKDIFVFLFILLFLSYPIAESLSHREISGWARYLLILGYYCLPYLLYFTLLAVTIEIVIVLGKRIWHFRYVVSRKPASALFPSADRTGCQFSGNERRSSIEFQRLQIS